MKFADLDGDLDLDALAVHGSLSAFRNDGAGVFAYAPLMLGGSQGIARCAPGDLDSDGDQDLVGVSNTAMYVASNLGGFFGPWTYTSSAAHGDAVALADFDLDGDVDVVVGFPLEIFVNDGAAGFVRSSAQLPSFPSSDAALIAEDFDDDDDPDLAIARWGRSIVLTNLARHCAWVTPPRIGSTMEIALNGPDNEKYLLLAAHAQTYVPLGNIGVLRVNRNMLQLRRYGRFDAHGRAIEPYPIPNDPLLAGTALYWQALIANPRRLTNLEVTTFSSF